jgi:hypothetical protein
MPRPITCRPARLLVGALSVATAAAWSAAARAQDAPPPAPIEAAPPPPVVQPAPPPAPPPPPPVVRVVEPEQPTVHNENDLDVEARRWAIGYTGVSQVETGSGTLTVPAIGVRYWTSPTLAVDFGLGFGWLGGSTEFSGMSQDKDNIYGFVVQGGVPIAISNHRHVSFQVIPFATFAHGQTTTGPSGASTDFSGNRLEVGARAGFELFFGFIGIPELALSATVGAQFERHTTSTTSGGLTMSDTTMRITTTVQNNPWDIFAGNVAARYYF